MQSLCGHPLLQSKCIPRIAPGRHKRRSICRHSSARAHAENISHELHKLLNVLPKRFRDIALEHPQLPQLVEVIMDLGRPPVMRLPNKSGASTEVALSVEPVSFADLHEAEMQVGAFNQDNRAGLDGTLHRISCIRNRAGRIVGLTCRVGRSIRGSAALVVDVVKEGKSLLLLGRPGVGKTTAVREIARMLSGPGIGKRTVIIDTSNEIGGDGDVPHAGIGDARRMQVANPDAQDRVMIEAVENHMPQAVIIDEISTEAECMAARTIAQRGVQLIATAHGNVLENVIKNPSLADLVGGIASVTLGDEAARKRGVQKTVLERAAPPTFDVVAEMVDRTHWCIQDTASAVDTILQGGSSPGIVRTYDPATGEVLGMDAQAYAATEARSAGKQASHEMLLPQKGGMDDYRLNMSSAYQEGGGLTATQSPSIPATTSSPPTKRPPPPRLPMPGDFAEDPNWDTQQPTARAVRRAAAEAVAAARGAGPQAAQGAASLLQPAVLQSPAAPPASPLPAPLTPTPNAAAATGPAMSGASMPSEAEGEAAGVWPSALAAAPPSEPMLQPRAAGGSRASGLGSTLRKGPRISVYMLMERNASAKVMSVLWQLVAEVQAAAAGVSYSVEVVDSLEDATLVLATRARLKNSPKVRAAIQRFKLPIYTLRSTSSTAILAKDLLPVLGLGPSASEAGKASDSDSEGYQDPPFIPSSANLLGRRGRASMQARKAAEGGSDSSSDWGGGGLEGQMFSASASASITSYGIIGLDSSDGSGTDSDGWEGDWTSMDSSWEEGSSPGNGLKGSSSAYFEVSASPSAQARLSMRAASDSDSEGAVALTPADDYADLICSLVRELRYAPLDREYSTQILNSFNMELALASPALATTDTSRQGKPESEEEAGTSVLGAAGSSPGTGAYACSAHSIAGLAWALSYTKHKKKFVQANRAGLLSLAEAAGRRWPEFSGQGLMQLAIGYAGLRLLPSKVWMAGLVEASQAAAAEGKLAPQQAGAISQALVALQAMEPCLE